jgi:hypothetical protein
MTIAAEIAARVRFNEDWTNIAFSLLRPRMLRGAWSKVFKDRANPRKVSSMV